MRKLVSFSYTGTRFRAKRQSADIHTYVPSVSRYGAELKRVAAFKYLDHIIPADKLRRQ